jgi:UDP-glucose 4-epimerase
MATYVITGMAGSLAQLCASRLIALGHEVIGVDYRPEPEPLQHEIIYYQANYNKTRIEDVFRRHQPKGILHLGRVGNLKMTPNKRFDLNVIGSTKIMELCLKYAVERLLVLSTFHIYGAHPSNHIPIGEGDPLRAGQTFPQLADAVQLDNQATTWVFQHRQVKTIMLRPTNIIGRRVQNAISKYLRQERLPYLIGFSPVWQFIDELDAVRAIELATFSDEVGVFNVAGGGEIPLHEALKLTGATLVPVPGFLAQTFVRASELIGAPFPPYLLDFFRYPCVVSDERFRTRFGYKAEVGLIDTIQSASLRLRVPR